MLLTVDKLIDVLCGSESITPNLHVQSDLKLMVSQFQEFLKSIFFVKSDWEGDL
jgi:hypothetical protein